MSKSPYARHTSHATTPQTQPLAGRAMVANAAGGYVFAIDEWARLRRFLILGSEGETYYAREREHTIENVDALLRCIAVDGPRVVREIADVSVRALAPKNDAAVFALAVASVKGDDVTRRAALESLPVVCRIGTHLFAFAAAREAIGGGWGRGVRKAVATWYDRDDLVLQLLKYQQRDGWAHRDLLRLAHPKPLVDKSGGTVFHGLQSVEVRNAALDAACAPQGGARRAPSRRVAAFGAPGTVNEAATVRHEGRGWAGVEHPLAIGYVFLQAYAKELAEGRIAPATRASLIASTVEKYRLPRELVPTEFLALPEVQLAMLPHLGVTALIRNLGNMSKSGLLKPLSACAIQVCERLTNEKALAKSRVHPFALLLASRTYAAGRGVRSRGEGWVVAPEVVAALDDAFQLSFGNIVATNKRHVLGVDVSGSMEQHIADTAVTSAEAAAAMALATVRSEPACYAFGFANDFRDLEITSRSTLQSVLQKTTAQNFGTTDCAVAIDHALKHSIEVDAFVIYTDNETWSGDKHTSVALQRYRKESGIPARLAVAAFTSTGRSVADAADAGSMDFVGLDASLPQALAAFVGGEV